ncbi:MAG: 50S ribosomal protein L4 [Alphaproteobacteria bacterium]|nr:50S ribosomal protein L4 [Alphaproteobacteria bacterium]
MKAPVVTLENKPAGEIELAEAVFGLKPRADILHRVVNWQLNRRRQGTHSTRTVSMVEGSTKKIYKQKGTGQARHGAKRAVQFRHGAVAFGPHPRSHETALQKKVRALGLCMALSSKQADGKLVVLDTAKAGSHKTKALAGQLAKNGWTSALFIDGTEPDVNFSRAAANLVGVDVLPVQGANVYDILRRDTLVLTRAAVEKLQERLA